MTGTPTNVDNTCALVFSRPRTGQPQDIRTCGSNWDRGIADPADRKGALLWLSGRCSQLRLARTGPYAGILSEGPEFETLYSLGGQTGVDDMDSIIAADRLCDELDWTASRRGHGWFAMELFEKGILTLADTGGLKLNFGNHEAMNALIRLMALREGIGDLLSDGVKMLKKIEKGQRNSRCISKGLNSRYDVRAQRLTG